MSLPISGFTAVPNPQMLAFMAAQSFVMMMQAGEGWQYGKRKQSAMTNEEFNKQSPLLIMERQMSELKTAIPTIEKSMNAMTPMIRTIVTQYGDFLAEIVKATPEVLKAAQGGQSLEGNILTVAKEFKQIAEGTVHAVSEADYINADPLVNAMANFFNSFAKIPQAFGHSADKSPEQIAFENIPEDEDISGAELTKATNEAEFNKRADEKAALERARIITEQNKLKATEGALRRKSIVESGLSPLAHAAREKFRTNIDTWVSNVQKSIGQVTSAKQNQPSNKGSHAYQKWSIILSAATTLQMARVKKLSALRIKYFQVYGEHY